MGISEQVLRTRHLYPLALGAASVVSGCVPPDDRPYLNYSYSSTGRLRLKRKRALSTQERQVAS